MTFHKRSDFNHEIVHECLELLKSPSENDQCKAIVFSAYLIEQGFKIALSKINPLLCVDKKQLTPQKEVLLASKRLTTEQSADIKTITASDCLEKACALDARLLPYKNNITDLFRFRNFILHSQEDIYFDPEIAAGQAISALRICKKHICRSLKLARSEFQPISSTEFRRIEYEGLLKELKELRKSIVAHKKAYSQMTPSSINERLTHLHGIFNDIYTCPACGEKSFQEITDVDHDWNPDGIISTAVTHYECVTCDLHLSSREEDLSRIYHDFIRSRRATLLPRNRPGTV